MLWMLLSAFVVFKPYPPALESGVLKPSTPPPPQNMGYSSPLHSCIRKFSAQAPPQPYRGMVYLAVLIFLKSSWGSLS